MSMIITLLGNPQSTNSIYRRHGHIMYMTTEGRKLKESYQWQAKAQQKGKLCLTGPLEIKVKFYFKDKHIRDWDNFHKLSMDALTGIVYVDDSQIKKATVEVDIDKSNPRIEIEVFPKL